MKMLQAQPYTATAINPILVPNHYFITPKKSISPRRVARTFSLNLPQFSVTCSHPELVQPKSDLKPLPSPPPPRSQLSSPPVGELPPKVFVSYSVYKEKAVLSVSPRLPVFIPLESGLFKIAGEGCLQLHFAPSIAPFQYDWKRKQVFLLSVEEIRRLINRGAKESFEFYHYSFLKESDEGKVRRVLKVEPLLDGSGHMFNLSVQNKPKNINQNISIPVTKAEFAVINSLANYIMPCFLGWKAFGNTIKPEV